MKRKTMLFVALVLAAMCFLTSCNGQEGGNDDEAVEAVMTLSYYDETEDDRQYEQFCADDTEPVYAVVSFDVAVSDVAVLSLLYEEDPQGGYSFSAREMMVYDRITPEKPLLLCFTDFGTIPHFGLSYFDGCGEKHSFAIKISGMDGSLIAEEIQFSMQ